MMRALPESLARLSLRPRFKSEAPAKESVRGPIAAGLVIIVAFFVGFGGWATIAPLNGAVVANGVVKVDGERKSLEHLEGGIVKQVLVSEGDRVEAGDVLLVLDPADIEAERDLLIQQSAMLRATEARLTAELNGAAEVDYPDDLIDSDLAFAKRVVQTQRDEFANRRTSIQGQKEVLQARIGELEQQVAGNQAQLEAYRSQRDSLIEERASLAGLLERGIVTRSRVLQLERTQAGLEGEIGSAQASIAAARDNIGEVRERMAQLERDRAADVSRELRDIQSKLLDITPRLRHADTRLERLEIRAPYSGKVVALKIFGAGAVIGNGEKILDIVPDQSALVVEAQIPVEEISEVHPGMAAELHLTSYKRSIAPTLPSEVRRVSADRLTDERTGIPYYVTSLDLPPETDPAFKIYPGMPVTVMITTEERTALDYLIGPLTASFDRAFRQR